LKHRIVGEVMTRYYNDNVIDDIESRLDIVDVVSETVNLTRKGNRYWGLCPFHGEKTPSFSVSAEKNMFYCFGCHTGGSMFTFVMKRDGVDFKEAIQILAAKAGVKIATAGPRKDDKTAGVFKINRAAGDFYQRYLQSEDGILAREYLTRRCINAQSIEQFKLGMAPDSWDGLGRNLLKKGFSQAELQLSGLIKRNENRDSYYDIFRNRLIFPIFNPRGDIIGFGGRVLDEAVPKYLNTPETDIFAKRKNLYGLFQGRDIIRQSNEAILVEGYLDCIMLHQAGIKNTVASLGTAFTVDQAKLIQRYAESVLILFDGDEAGQRETMKAIEVLSQQGMKIFICSLPDEMDPDEFLNKYGKEEFEDYIKNNRISHIEFKIDRFIRLMPELDLHNKINVVNGVKDDVINLKSELEKDYHIKTLARKLEIEEFIIRQEIKPKGRYSEREGILRNKTEIIRDNKKYANYSIEEKIMASFLAREEHFHKIKDNIGLDFFVQPELQKLAQYYDQLSGDPADRQKQLKTWAAGQGLEETMVKITFALDEEPINEVQLDNFMNDVKRKQNEVFWQNASKKLDSLGNGDFKTLLSFILDFDTALNNFQEGGKA
jgi:DNA primase